jgi:hypothetical protein
VLVSLRLPQLALLPCFNNDEETIRGSSKPLKRSFGAEEACDKPARRARESGQFGLLQLAVDQIMIILFN